MLIFRLEQKGLQERGLGLWGHALSVSNCVLSQHRSPQMLLTTQQGRSPVPIPQKGIARLPGDRLCSQSLNSGPPLSKIHTFSLLGLRNVHLSNPAPYYLLADGQGQHQRGCPSYAMSQAIFRPCLGYRHPNTFNRWQDHPNVLCLKRSRHHGERTELNQDVYMPGVWFQLCLPLWNLRYYFTNNWPALGPTQTLVVAHSCRFSHQKL